MFATYLKHLNIDNLFLDCGLLLLNVGYI